jgi:hypothetical protein
MSEAEYLNWRSAQRDAALAALTEAIDAIEAERRSPDPWERTTLLRGLSAVFHGLYDLGIVEAGLARTPVDQRSPQAILLTDHAAYGSCDVPFLRKAVTAVGAEPVRRFPFFGQVQ